MELIRNSKLPATKKELSNYIKTAKDNLLSGNYDPLKLAHTLKIMEEIVKNLRNDKEVKEMIQEEAEKYPEKTIDFSDFSITKTERKTKDYTGIDTVLDDLNAVLEKTKAMIKVRQSVIDLKVNPETGELFKPVPYKSQTVLTVKIK